MTVESAPILGSNNRDALLDAPKAAIAAPLMAAAGSNTKVVQILEWGPVAGTDIDLRYNHTKNQEDESPCIPSDTRTYWTS